MTKNDRKDLPYDDTVKKSMEKLLAPPPPSLCKRILILSVGGLLACTCAILNNMYSWGDSVAGLWSEIAIPLAFGLGSFLGALFGTWRWLIPGLCFEAVIISLYKTFTEPIEATLGGL